jgi:hypothetical protein
MARPLAREGEPLSIVAAQKPLLLVRWQRLLADGFDLLIAVYAISLVLTVFTGGIALGFLSVHNPTKPILMLLVLVPVRVAWGASSRVGDRLLPIVMRVTARLAGAWRRLPPAVRDSVITVGSIRLATLSAAFLGNLVFDEARPRGFAMPFEAEKFAEVFAAWDSGWYWDIARNGYYFRPDGESSVAFFPLYPMLVRLVAAPFGSGDEATWVAAILVSSCAYLLGLIALYRLTEQLFGTPEVARRVVVLVAVFPWSIFFGRVYTEGLFLLLTVLAVSRAYEGEWTRAGLWGALAVLTRPNGILIGVPIALLALRDRPSMPLLARRFVPLALLPAALAGYSAYVYALAGDPLAWMAAQSHWNYTIGNLPWRQLVRIVSTFVGHGPYDYFFTSPAAGVELLQGVTALVAMAVTPFVFRYLGVAMGAYMLVSLLVPLSGSSAAGWGRYVSVLFPGFILVGSLVSPRALEVIVIVCMVFSTLLACFFVTWQPIF